ncbi:hypothetical protein [Gemmobacter sp.]|uniref:calcium-binding protein n=1 Tax=Gemmobacter sp. TaxID=1898957 RepID=UPI0025C43A52|nr:hypothetical protein [Gemmobacter sp.]
MTISISIEGNLAALMTQMVTGMGSSDVYLGYGRAISVSLGDWFYGGLSGEGVTILQSGSRALEGSFNYASLIKFDAGFTSPMTISGFHVDAGAVFRLAGRDASGVYVTYNQTALQRAFNAEALRISGSEGDDVIAPGQVLKMRKADRLFGQAGNDLLSGGLGADTLMGGAGQDRLLGGAGADQLEGGNHSDVLTGGKGGDRFVFSGRSGADVITDFTDGLDMIRLAGAHRLEEVDEGTLISHDGGTILLRGVDMALIDAEDFL